MPLFHWPAKNQVKCSIATVVLSAPNFKYPQIFIHTQFCPLHAIVNLLHVEKISVASAPKNEVWWNLKFSSVHTTSLMHQLFCILY